MQEVRFPEKLEGNYRYMPLPNSNGKADVMIYRFKEEVENENGEKEFIYDYNSFRTSKLKEENINKNPLAYLDYTEKEKTEKEKMEEKVEKNKSQIDYIAMMTDVEIPEGEEE